MSRDDSDSELYLFNQQLKVRIATVSGNVKTRMKYFEPIDWRQETRKLNYPPRFVAMTNLVEKIGNIYHAFVPRIY